MLRRLAAACYRRRRLVVLAWIVSLGGIFAVASAVGGTFEDSFSLPGAESQRASDVLESGGFRTQAGFQGQLVIHADDGVRSPAVARSIEDLLADIRSRVDGVNVSSPYEPENQRQINENGTIAYAQLSLAPRDDPAYDHAVEQIRQHVEAAEVPARLELAGDRFIEASEEGSEVIGLLGAVVVLLIAFGSVLAMGLPIVTALFGIGTGVAVVMLFANVLRMPSFTIQLVLMLGLGVGIDYALFIVTRYREGLSDGRDPAHAVELSIDTAGRAVVFAGSTVVVSVLGLVAVGLDVNRALGVAAAVGVLMTMLGSITLLPALLGFIGTNIDRFGLPHRRSSGREIDLWTRWSRTIQRHPKLPAAITLSVLVLLALPMASMRLGFGDAGNRPTSDTTRRAYDLLAEGFGPGTNGPLVLAAAAPDEEAERALTQLVETVGSTTGVASISRPVSDAGGDVAFVQVIPTTAPQSEATTDLVHRLRNEVVPTFTSNSDLTVHVGGAAAAAIDFADFNAERLPVFIAAVLAVSFLLLVMVFRSVLVPLKAVIMNLLSIGAAYGVIVAVFQWGWGADLFGIGKPGPVEAWAPLMMFAIVFGLSMDYEVFLLSRIREDYDRTADNASAVTHGLAATGRVITAAAAIMVLVFGAFALSPDRSLQMFGLGLATAVLVDATLVRLVIVPATMELLGDRNWWLPGWLGRIMPAINVEGSAHGIEA